MPRAVLQLAALFAGSMLAFSAAGRSQAMPAQDQSGLYTGVTIPDVPGLPFSATVVIEFEQQWPDGGSETFRTINLIGRDRNGRTHNEKRRFMPQNFHGSPALLGVRLSDPLRHVQTLYEPSLHIARELAAPEPEKPDADTSRSIHSEDLGVTTLDGLQARGTRKTYTLSAKASGVGERVTIEDEEWYSKDLQIDLLIRHNDPRIGTQTIGLSNLKREDPPAALFQVPAGYQILHVSTAPPAKPKSPSDETHELNPHPNL